MKILLLAATIALAASGQTQVSLEQINGPGTSPNLVWQRGDLIGQHVHPSQVRLPTIALRISGYRHLTIEVGGVDACEVVLNHSFIGVVQVFFYKGRIAVLSGYSDDTGYRKTQDLLSITGPCIAADTEIGQYPSGINAFLWFSTVGMLEPSAQFKGVEIDFTPHRYTIDNEGFLSVSN